MAYDTPALETASDLMAHLPAEFVGMLWRYGQLVDLDGDGRPDLAIVPLHHTHALQAEAATIPAPENLFPDPKRYFGDV